METKFVTSDGYTLRVLITESTEVFTDGDLAFELTSVSAQQGMCTIPVPVDSEGQTLDGVLYYDGSVFHVRFNDDRGVTEVTS